MVLFTAIWIFWNKSASHDLLKIAGASWLLINLLDHKSQKHISQMSTVSGKCSANSVAASGNYIWDQRAAEQPWSREHRPQCPLFDHMGGGALAQAGSPTLHHTVRIWEDITGGVTQSISKSITHRHRVKTSNSYGTVSYKMMTNWTAWLQWNQSFLSYEE